MKNAKGRTEKRSRDGRNSKHGDVRERQVEAAKQQREQADADAAAVKRQQEQQQQ